MEDWNQGIGIGGDIARIKKRIVDRRPPYLEGASETQCAPTVVQQQQSCLRSTQNTFNRKSPHIFFAIHPPKAEFTLATKIQRFKRGEKRWKVDQVQLLLLIAGIFVAANSVISFTLARKLIRSVLVASVNFAYKRGEPNHNPNVR